MVPVGMLDMFDVVLVWHECYRVFWTTDSGGGDAVGEGAAMGFAEGFRALGAEGDGWGDSGSGAAQGESADGGV